MMMRGIESVCLALCLSIIGVCFRDIYRHIVAPRLERGRFPSAHPTVSVIIPARNEVGRIGRCVASLAAQTVLPTQILVVDDQSEDATAAEALQAAGTFPVEVVAGSILPDGWAGKCWACWQGVSAANGEWLLFLDADVVASPELVASMLHEVQQHKLAMLTLIPHLILGSLAERLVLPAFHTILLGLYPLHQVSDPRSRLAFANGQCILIHREAYLALDGHRGVRASVLEDTVLGQRVKAAGYAVRAAAAPQLLAVRMYTDWRTVVEGLRKNATAGYASGGIRSGWVGVRQMLIAFGPLWLAAAARWVWQRGSRRQALLHTGMALSAGSVSSATMVWLFWRRHRLGPVWGLCYPIGLAVYLLIAASGFVRVWLGRGVVWKGRTIRGQH